MKSTLIFLALLGFLANCDAAVSTGSYHDPNHPGKCAIKPELILSPGEHKDPDSPCGRIVCEEDGTAQIQTCGFVALPDGCTFGDYKDTSLNYPDCCEKHIHCKDDNDHDH